MLNKREYLGKSKFYMLKEGNSGEIGIDNHIRSEVDS